MIVATFFGLHPIVRELQSSLWSRGSLLENIDEPTEEGITALMISSIRGDGMTTQALLDCGANVNNTTKTGSSCLHLACLFSNSVIGLLLQRGAAVNARNQSGYTPLHVAAFSFLGGNVILKLLLNYGADLYATTADGDNALHLASEQGNLPFLEAFLDEILRRHRSPRDNGSSEVSATSIINAQNARGSTSLHAACGRGVYGDSETQQQIIQKLFGCGADPYLRNNSKQTPLELAVRKDPPRVIETLQELILARQLAESVTSRPSRLS
jgi:ankyrin repeat protein